MLNAIKDALTRATPARPLTPSTPDAAANTVAGKRLAKGRTRARVDALAADLDDARLASVQAHQQLGECVNDELDVRAPTDALKHAEDRVQALEAALIVAKQKDDAAQIALKAAELAVTEEARQAARGRVTALAPKGEHLLAAVAQFSMDLARETEALLVAGGFEQCPSGFKEIREQFELSLSIAVTGNRPPERLTRFTSWTDCLTAICGRD